MDDFSKVEIVFKITTWRFPTFRFLGGHDWPECKTERLKVEAFKSLCFVSQDLLPSRHYHVALEESRIEEFYAEVSRLVLVKYKNISKVQVSLQVSSRSKGISSRIRDTKLTKALAETIFDIPELPNNGYPSTLPNREAILRAQKSSKLSAYFQVKNAWLPESQIASYDYALSEHVGHTGRSEAERSKGEELKCSVEFEDSSFNKIDYVFTTPPKLHYMSEMGVYYEFYLITKQVEAELEADFKRLAIKHKGFLKIDLLTNLFGSNLIKAVKDCRSDYDKFSKEYGSIYRYEYLSSGQLVAKSTYGNLIYSRSSEVAIGLPNKDRAESSRDMYTEREKVLNRGFDPGPVSFSYSCKMEYCGERQENLIIDERSKEYVPR